MSRKIHQGPKLPSTLLSSIDSTSHHGSLRSRNSKKSIPLSRKEQRKASRVEKRQHQQQPHLKTLQPFEQIHQSSISGGDQQHRAGHDAKPSFRKSLSTRLEGAKRPEKTTKPVKVKSPRPPTSQGPNVPRAVRLKLEEDDAEIAALERKLGMKKTKSNSAVAGHSSFATLLEELGPQEATAATKRKWSDYEDYLSSKRRQISTSEPSDSDVDLVGSQSDAYSSSEDPNLSEKDSHEEETQKSAAETDSIDFYELESDASNAFELVKDAGSNGAVSIRASEPLVDSHQRTTRRENPYVAPIQLTSAASSKYVPPAKRSQPMNTTEDLRALQRQLKGLLNRLSEANLLSILRDVERIYTSNARQHVTTVIVDLLLELLCDRSSLMDTFVILHAGFAAAVFKVIGAHFGAQLLERVVTDFERHYEVAKTAASPSKETTNLIGLLAELYTFQLVGCTVIFDYIRIFLRELSDINTELLLKIIKNCGPQLRHDDPTSLKDIVILLQKSVTKVGEVNLPVRTKFMIETINDLKNNRVKAGASASILAADHTSRIKKMLISLNMQAKSTEPLGVRLDDIKSSNKDEKWWLVGASWKNVSQKDDLDTGVVLNENAPNVEKAVQGATTGRAGGDLLALAKQQRMNTDIRAAIFMNIMSAEDFKDAHTRLTRLKLKKAQELEIPRVLIHCAAGEENYNPYYTLIAKQLCSEHRYKWAMQYGLWDLFKRMGEKSGFNEDFDDEMGIDEDDSIDLKKLVNLGRMYGHLIADDILSLTSLKVLNFAYLQAKTKSFLEVMMSTIFKNLSKAAKQSDAEHDKLESGIGAVFLRAKEASQVISGLQYFLSKEADLEKIASSHAERKATRRALKTSLTVLSRLSTSLS